MIDSTHPYNYLILSHSEFNIRKLYGRLSDSIGHLTNLNELYIHFTLNQIAFDIQRTIDNNNIYGIIPDSIGNMIHLRVLFVRFLHW